MPGAVVVVEPGPPQRRARHRVDVAPGEPLGPAQPRHRDHPLQHQGERPHRLGRGRADRDGPGDVGGPVRILRAAVDQQQLARRHRPVRGLVDPVVHDRPVRPGAADRVERDVAQAAAGGPARFEPADHVDLGQPALRRGRRRARRGRSRPPRRRAGAPPGCRRARPRFFCAFGRMQGSRSQTTSAPAASAGRRPRPARWPGRPPPGRAGRRAPARRPRARPRSPPARGGRAVRASSLAGSVKSATRAVGAEDGEGERHRRAGDVGAAHVEEPGDRVGQRQDRRREVARDEAARELGPLRRPTTGPASSAGCGTIGRAGGGGWSGQARSTRFATRTRPICRGPERLGERLDLLGGVQPRVEPEAAAARQRRDQPVLGLVLGVPLRLEAPRSTSPCTCSR